MNMTSHSKKTDWKDSNGVDTAYKQLPRLDKNDEDFKLEDLIDD